MTTFDDYREYFSGFYTSVKEGHHNASLAQHGGHGFDHDVTVATLATRIASSPDIAKKAWCAGMLHSVDRMVEEEKVKSTMIAFAERLRDIFTHDEIIEIVEAAFRHSERNQNDQSEVQITLMDADRLANMQMSVIMRAGQFRATLPIFDFCYLEGTCDPTSTYENPKSILDNLRIAVDSYIPQLRLEKSKELGALYSKRIFSYIDTVEQDYKDLGLINVRL